MHVCVGRTVGKHGPELLPSSEVVEHAPARAMCCCSPNAGAPATSSPGNKLKMEEKMPCVHLCGSVWFLAEWPVQTAMRAMLHHLRTLFHFNAPFIFPASSTALSEALRHLSVTWKLKT